MREVEGPKLVEGPTPELEVGPMPMKDGPKPMEVGPKPVVGSKLVEEKLILVPMEPSDDPLAKCPVISHSRIMMDTSIMRRFGGEGLGKEMIGRCTIWKTR
jgi:hypothetical protein